MRFASDGLLLLAFLSSGISALGLELIWVRILGLAFGSETFGVLGVLTGFFAGLAIGAAVLHGFILRHRRPVLVYFAAEIVIAVYAAIGPFLMLRLADAIPHWLGPLVGDNRSLVALSLNLVIAMAALLPATVAMGATVVALVEAWRRRRATADNATTVAWLYTANTLGATAGIVLTTYWLLPQLGIQAASALLGLFNLLAVALAWRWEQAQTLDRTVAPSPESPPDAYSRPRVYALLFFTGLAGIGLETLGTQVLAQIFHNTVHTFANIVAIYLLGTSVGARLYASRWLRGLRENRGRGTVVLLYGLSLAAIAAATVLARSAGILDALAPPGSSYSQVLLGEAIVSALVFVPPTLLMGATYSHLLAYFTYDGVGYASAWNTAGASIAPFLFGLVLIPLIGYGGAFYVAVAAYFLLFAIMAWGQGQRTWRPAAAGAVAVLAGVLAFSPLVLIRFASGSRLVGQRVGFQGVVSVTQNPAGNRILQVGQRTLMGGSPGLVTQRMGDLPMLIAPAPRQTLFLGAGTGITAGSALAYPVDRVTAVELLPEVFDMLPWFGEYNHNLQRDPRSSLHVTDARRFIGATRDIYDVIVADLYHPSIDGTGSLYTLEHFTAVRGRLRDRGLFVQWLPLYQLPPRELKTIIRTFLAVFPRAHSVIANYSADARFGLMGWAPGLRGVEVPRVEALLAARPPGRRVFEGVPDMLAAYMLDAAALREFAGDGPINTDGNQRIVFDAAPAASIYGAGVVRSLASLLPYRRLFPADFIAAPGPGGLPALQQDIRSYAEAVALYLKAELEPKAVVEDYLKAYQADVRFTLAPGRILEISLQNPAATKQIVMQIYQVHPEQPEFNRLRQRLETVDAPDQVRAIVARFIQTGGD